MSKDKQYKYTGPTGKLSIRGFTFKGADIPQASIPRYIARFPEIKDMFEIITPAKEDPKK
jgi:hypothetical protein